jgi:hypothetical protein
MSDFDERWLQPGGIVPVDVPTTGALVREILRLRAPLETAALLCERQQWMYGGRAHSMAACRDCAEAIRQFADRSKS